MIIWRKNMSTKCLYAVVAGFLVWIAGCCPVQRIDPSEQIVAAPITERANIVLTNLTKDCQIVNRRWTHDMGCTPENSAMFGYRVGMHRNRKDLIKLGRLSANNEWARFVDAMFRFIVYKEIPQIRDLNGTGALLVSGISDRNALHYAAYRLIANKVTAPGMRENLGVIPSAGTAFFLAEMYRVDKSNRESRIAGARFFADQAGNKNAPTFAAGSWAAIAKSTGDPNDIARAKEIIRSVYPKFTTSENGKSFNGPYAEYLSCHLAMIHALADMAQIEASGPWREEAIDLLHYIFSDAYFNGRFLVHHRENDQHSKTFCAGCNFCALYLADRIYGNTLWLDKIKLPRVVTVKLKIISAKYGAENTWVDVTSKLRKMIRDNRLTVQASDALAGDPVPGATKSLQVVCELNGKRHSVTVSQGGWLSLPN